MGLGDVDPHELCDAMDWLVERQGGHRAASGQALSAGAHPGRRHTSSIARKASSGNTGLGRGCDAFSKARPGGWAFRSLKSVDDPGPAAAEQQRAFVVQKAKRSPAARAKAGPQTHRRRPSRAQLVEVDGALEGVVRLALVQADLDAASHPGVGGPVDHEQGAFDAADLSQGGRQLVLARVRGELAQDLAGPQGPRRPWWPRRAGCPPSSGRSGPRVRRQLLWPLALPHLRMLPVCLRKIVPMFCEVGAASGPTLGSSWARSARNCRARARSRRQGREPREAGAERSDAP